MIGFSLYLGIVTEKFLTNEKNQSSPVAGIVRIFDSNR